MGTRRRRWLPTLALSTLLTAGCPIAHERTRPDAGPIVRECTPGEIISRRDNVHGCCTQWCQWDHTWSACDYQYACTDAGTRSAVDR